MRAKWHRQFATPRFEALFQRVPVYWQKDDHDYRYNDADPYGTLEPSHELGASVFLEQVPVAPAEDEKAVTYRTHRIGDLLQIWLLEGRDYRDSNIAPPGPEKTMWGAAQRHWLQETLLASDAVFKVLISPTPMIGPDDKMAGGQGGILGRLVGSAVIGQEGDNRKRDNHTNPYGFKDEAEAFFAWLAENGFLERDFYIVCGDRHWQYHSIRPDGFEEFSSGALVDGNARLGRKPGDPMSTDPDASDLPAVYTGREIRWIPEGDCESSQRRAARHAAVRVLRREWGSSLPEREDRPNRHPRGQNSLVPGRILRPSGAHPLPKPAAVTKSMRGSLQDPDHREPPSVARSR